MIDFVSNREQIVYLWKSVFNDSEDYINFFLDGCKNKTCLGYFVDDCLVSMMFLIDCSFCSCNGKYVYAVATDSAFRNRGYASKLIEEAKKQMGDFLWLIPADEELFDYYSKFGFETKLYSNSAFENKIEFNEIDEIISELYEGSAFENPKGMLYSLKFFSDGDTGLINKGE